MCRFIVLVACIGSVLVSMSAAAPVRDLPRAASVSARSAAIAFTATNATIDVYVVNGDGSGLRRLVRGYGPVWSPDGRRLVFSRLKDSGFRAIHHDEPLPWNALFSVRADGSGLQHLSPASADDEYPSWSPDGLRLVFVHHRHNASGYREASQLYVMRADGRARRLVAPCSEQGRPAWSPDGRQIAFVGRGQTLMLVRPDGTGVRRLPGGVAFETGPAWSPEGRRVVFVGADSNLYVTVVSTGKRTRVASGDIDGRPDWSPDGRKIVFHSWASRTFASYIGVVPSTGGRVRHVASYGYDPAWSPDGRAIAYTTDGSLRVAEADGGRARRITPSRLGAEGPLAWQPS